MRGRVRPLGRIGVDKKRWARAKKLNGIPEEQLAAHAAELKAEDKAVTPNAVRW
jgi:hypothetical protein